MGVKWLLPLLLVLIESRRLFVDGEVMMTGDQEAVVVAFPRDVPEEKQLDIVKSVKKLITETSQFLHASIGLPIRKVNLVIPHLWRTNSEGWNELGSISYSTPSEKPSNADISVEVSGSYLNGPIAIQHRTCGSQGRRIVLPIEFIHQEKSNNEAKLFAREWIKYKYGVFDENGYSNDARFPKYYKIPGSTDDDVKINDCANIPVNYTFQDVEGQNCSLEVHRTSALPIENSTCLIHILPEENEEVKSSIMDKDLLDLPNVDTICDNDKYSHNSHAPNKQNTFCNGQSILDVVKRHKDFKEKINDLSEEIKPTFRLLKQQNFRVVVAVDNTEGLKQLKGALKNSLGVFAFTLPDNSELCILKFKDSVTTLVTLETLDSSIKNRDDILKPMRFEFSKPKGQPQIQMAIENAVKILVPKDMPQFGTIVIVSSAVPKDLSFELVQKLNSVCLVVMAIDEVVAKGFEQFLEIHKFDSTCSKIFLISNDSSTALKEMNEIFDSIIDHNSYHEQNVLLKDTELSSKLPLSFVVDSSIASFDIWLTSHTDIELESDDFEFVNSDGKQTLQDYPLSNQQIMVFQVSEPKVGRWECALSVEDKTLLTKVIAKTKNESSSLTLNVWTEMEADNDGFQQPIILYAEVFSGGYPIIDASVKARVTSPNGSETNFELLDNGFGDPDMTLHDGIYTRYFTQFSVVGDYKVFITVDDNKGNATVGYEADSQTCCGSEIRYTNTRSTGMFRIRNEAKFRATHNKSSDGYEPSRVLNLKAIGTFKPSVFTLEWTAPGNEKDQDTAKEYNLKIFKTKEDAYNSFFDSDEKQVQTFKSEELIPPSPYGTFETVDIKLNDNVTVDTNYYICLRAISDKGKSSQVSNVAEIYLSSKPIVGTDEPEPTTDIDSVKGSPISHTKAIGIAIGAFILVAIFIVIAYVSFYCYTKRKTQKKNDVESTDTQKPNKASKPSEDTDGSVTANEWKLDKDPISPVNSVPAKVLLLHHEQVKDAKMKHKDPPLFTLERLRETEMKDAENISEEHPPEAILQPRELQNESNEVAGDTDDQSHSKPIRRITNV